MYITCCWSDKKLDSNSLRKIKDSIYGNKKLGLIF